MIKLNTKSFIEKSKIIHQYKFSYAKSIFSSYKEKLIITCPVHGDFLQTPKMHLQGRDCIKCAAIKRNSLFKLNTTEFILKSKEKHGDRYDYKKTEYKNFDTAVSIICPVHGEFLQRSGSHLKGYGCQKCYLQKRALNDRADCSYIINRFQEEHSDRYDYSLVNYINYDTNIKIICRIHGEFLQTPSNHIAGKGCQECKKLKISQYQIMTQEEFLKLANAAHANKYDYSKFIYKGANIIGIATCPLHGDFKIYPYHHIRKFAGCQKCSPASKGEEKIKILLNENNISYTTQKTFEYCRNPSTNRKLRFDFYLEDLNTLIEYDGIQHFVDISDKIKSWKSYNFNKLIFCDKIKDDFCKSTNIPLIRIKYSENIKQKLIEKGILN